MTRSELNLYLRQDAKNAGVRLGFIHSVKRMFFPTYCFLYIKLLRESTFYKSSGNIFLKAWGNILFLRLHYLSAKLGFYIPKDVFGPGLYIPHYGSVIVNPNCKIGANCQINNNVVLGQVEGKCPTLGDNVFIGSGAVICGDVKIANNVWIGANSVVTHDIVEDGALVVGVPAKIIRIKETNWLGEILRNEDN